jgi:hypothetical protein|tara:strand:+ start:574 stop:804 length:231 start_codon:yes stop_codon:yes gene_type:complete
MTLFKSKELVHNPKVLIRKDTKDADVAFDVRQLEGPYYRVFPANMKEISFIRTLKKNIFVYTPAHGDGLIVTLNLF